MTIYEQLHHAIFDGVDDVCTEESSNIELLPIELTGASWNKRVRIGQEEFYESIDMNETKNIPSFEELEKDVITDSWVKNCLDGFSFNPLYTEAFYKFPYDVEVKVRYFETINKRIEICLATECFSEDAWLRYNVYRAIGPKEIVNNDQSLRVDKTLRDIFRKTISQHGGIYAN